MTKKLLLAALIVLAFPLTAHRASARSSGEETIRKLYASYDETWNKGDAAALAAFWADDASHMEPDGHIVAGRTALAKELAERLGADLKGTRSHQTIEAIRFLTADVAVVDASYEVTGAHDLAGKSKPPIQGRYVDIWVKRSGKWKITVDRPVAPPAHSAD